MSRPSRAQPPKPAPARVAKSPTRRPRGPAAGAEAWRLFAAGNDWEEVAALAGFDTAAQAKAAGRLHMQRSAALIDDQTRLDELRAMIARFRGYLRSMQALGEEDPFRAVAMSLRVEAELRRLLVINDQLAATMLVPTLGPVAADSPAVPRPGGVSEVAGLREGARAAATEHEEQLAAREAAHREEMAEAEQAREREVAALARELAGRDDADRARSEADKRSLTDMRNVIHREKQANARLLDDVGRAHRQIQRLTEDAAAAGP
jgi:hypothetical protein